MEKNLKNYISTLKNNLFITQELNNKVGYINKQLQLLLESNKLRYEEKIQFGGSLKETDELNDELDSKIKNLTEKVERIKQKALKIQEKTNSNLEKTIKSISSFNKLNQEVDNMLGDDKKMEEVISQIDINKIFNLSKTSESNLLLESSEKTQNEKDVLIARYTFINDLFNIFIIKSKDFSKYIPENLYNEKYKNEYTILTKELIKERNKNINTLLQIFNFDRDEILELIEENTYNDIVRLINDEKNNNIEVKESDLKLIMKLDVGINNLNNDNPELFDKFRSSKDINIREL